MPIHPNYVLRSLLRSSDANNYRQKMDGPYSPMVEDMIYQSMGLGHNRIEPRPPLDFRKKVGAKKQQKKEEIKKQESKEEKRADPKFEDAPLLPGSYDNYRYKNDRVVVESEPKQSGSLKALKLTPDNKLALAENNETEIKLKPESVMSRDVPKPSILPEKPTLRKDFDLNKSLLQAERLSDLPSPIWLRFIGQLGKASAIPIYGQKPDDTLSDLSEKLYTDLEKTRESLRKEELERQKLAKDLESHQLENVLKKIQIDYLPQEKEAALRAARTRNEAGQIELSRLAEKLDLDLERSKIKNNIEAVGKKIAELKLKREQASSDAREDLASKDSELTKTLQNLIKEELDTDVSHLTGDQIIEIWDQLKMKDRPRSQEGLSLAQRFGQEDKLRTEFNKITEDNRKFLTNYKIVERLVKGGEGIKPSPYNRAALIYLFNKILDSDSVVRESEVELTLMYAGIKNRILNYKELLSGGGPISQETARQILKTIEDFNFIRERITARKAKEYLELAQKRGLDPASVVSSSDLELFNKYYNKKLKQDKAIERILEDKKVIESRDQLERYMRSPKKSLDTKEQIDEYLKGKPR